MKDVVVTGIGIMSALGETPDNYWARLDAGEVAIRRATPAELGVDAPVLWAPMTGFDPGRRFDPRIVAGTDRYAQLLMAAAVDAVAHAGLDGEHDLDPRRTAVFTGTSMGGLTSVIDAQQALDQDGPDAIPRKVQIMMWPNMGAAQLAYRWKLHGPQLTLCTACASSADAIGIGARHIEAGLADVAIVGGSDAQLRPLVLLSAGGLGAGSAATDPLRASLPFDRARSGMVIGEGGAALVLESRAHAAARGATPLAAVAGYGSLGDSYHPSSPDPSGEWQALTMQEALDDSGLDVTDVGAVIAHGTATRVGDVAELRALNRYLGPHAGSVKVASIKGHVGHASGGAAAMSAVAAIGILQGGRIPMNAGTTDPEDGADFEIVTGQAAAVAPGAGVQVNAFGFGGQNASLLFAPA